MASTLGRPKTGAFKEYRTKTPDSGPHGLAADKDGNIWFTASFQGYIGKLDPKTGTIIEYHLPDPAARDPHTPVFDRTGVLWFTVQGANMVGRLVPQTGEVKLQPVPTPNALPYGIAVNSGGVPFFAEFGSNKLASIDPAGKVDRLQSEVTTKLAKASERPIDHRSAVPRAAATKARAATPSMRPKIPAPREHSPAWSRPGRKGPGADDGSASGMAVRGLSNWARLLRSIATSG
jgi:streptogramin lyase